MEFITSFIFHVARTVVANVLTELIRGRKREVEVKHDEIREIINDELKKQNHQNSLKKDKTKDIVKDVIHEIEILSDRHPSLKVRQKDKSISDLFSLEKPIPKTLFSFGQKKNKEKNKELIARLDQLDKIVDQRKEEHRLREESEIRAEQSTVTEWKDVGKPEKKGYWEQQLVYMEDRINRRHHGEVLKDE
ncbi:hypothetical protein [Spirulina sp. 06S082]|uniref:hypothetical protein n=1 Tax=Spirulina sp. 06S082 TaxID=3110248 RepID=UPI002B1EA8CD|nr:hypothetical protein [Spirulina sp. 06S082]MEA5470986.1 hypothetical protein [Spirulina sp. 06S082]